ncbi:MAG TPA: xanthine dehydrogenase family protein molybdopterin-binding subunit [Acidimicrobiia bacterium]|nr:xanthine dehydrogenase family protein molybdopterin-binding subunit [Acidimicrobiia bacterium]
MATTSVMGGAVRRREDPALIQGYGEYVDDLSRTGLLQVAFVRSPVARAKITSLDTSAAKAMPGVVAVYTHDDVAHLGPLVAQVPIGKLRPLLAAGEVNHVGEAVAMVVAEDRYSAQDAADAVEVDYDVLPPVIDLKKAASDEVKVHDELDSNVIHTWTYHGYWEALGLEDQTPQVDAAMEREDAVVVSLEMVNQRLIPVAIEPRSVMAEYNKGYGQFTVFSSTQVPHALGGAIATTFGMKTTAVRVIAPEVGGGFGSKLNVYNDEILAAFAAKELGRPVKWTETRREASGSTIHGRGWVGTATLVGTKDGEFLGYKLDALADMGAYTQNFTVAIPLLGLWIGSGQYKMPVSWTVACVVTNTMTTDAYRGAGRPEAIYYLERIIDAFAHEIGMDPLEVRKKNFWQPDEFPAVMGCGFALDSGNYEAAVDKLIAQSDYAGMRKRQEEARAEGRLVGVGVGSYVEVCGFGPAVLADIGFSWSNYGLPASFNGSGLVRVNPDATVTVVIGTGPTGQGHETTWAQIVGDGLGIPVEDIRVLHGDTREHPMGIGTFGSRSIAVDGAATFEATKVVKAKAAKIAAHLLEASDEDMVFVDGGAHVAGSPDKSVDWAAIAKAAYQSHTSPDDVDGGLEAHTSFSPGNATWPFGTHIALVEVDPDTGNVELLEYHGVDDCGEVINPMIVNGQIHGGIAQGIGQAMFEEAIYDADGNMLTGSLLDYPLPTAADLPSFDLSRTVTPTPINPMGVKGIGEAGTIGSAHTIVNAVVDALTPMGVKHVDMPVRPKKVWQAMQEARA